MREEESSKLDQGIYLFNDDEFFKFCGNPLRINNNKLYCASLMILDVVRFKSKILNEGWTNEGNFVSQHCFHSK